MTADSSKKSPSVLGVYFYASLMALFGALLGFVYMTTFSAKAFASQAEYEAALAKIKEPTPAPKPGDAYYIEGDVSRTRSWEPKRTQMAATGAQTVRITVGEINAWMDAKIRSGVPPSGDAEPSVLIVPGVPNMAIADADTIYFNLPTTVAAYGASREYIISARCTLDGSAGVQFQSVRVSSAKVPLPDILGAKIFDVLVQGYQSTEEYKIISEAFARADSIGVEGNELIFKLR